MADKAASERARQQEVAGLDAVQKAIEAALLKIYELELTVQDFNGDQALLHSRLQALVVGLQELQARSQSPALRADAPAPIEIPIDLLRHLDGGEDSDVFGRELFHRAFRANRAARGAITGLTGLRDELLAQAEAAFPESAAEYRRVIAQPADQPAQPGAAAE